jgi:hypothetical protein
MGPGRRTDNCSYPGPQSEEEDNLDHGARQRSAGHEETTGRTHSFTDIEKGEYCAGPNVSNCWK